MVASVASGENERASAAAVSAAAATAAATALRPAGNAGDEHRKPTPPPRASSSSSSSSDARSCEPFLVHGGDALTSELLARCPSLHAPYRVPAWCQNPHAQTLLGYARGLTIFLKYDRQLVTCEDGGVIGLDWLVKARFDGGDSDGDAFAGGGSHSGRFRRRAAPRFPRPAALDDNRIGAGDIPRAASLPLDAPVFIMLHGINGGSHEGPTKWAVATGAARGWRCVALNLRGCNGVPLASPKVYCAASSSDVRAAVRTCEKLYPNAPILLAGYSLGTYVIGTYLAEEDSRRTASGDGDRDDAGNDADVRRGDALDARVGSGVAGAVLISCPLDPHSSHAGLSDPDKPSGLLYNGTIASELRRYFYKHEKRVVEHPEVDEKALNIAELRTIRDFERAVIVITHGFEDIDAYYDYFSPARLIPSIRTPTLYLNARDDPFMGDRAQCEAAIRDTKHVALAHVAKGGHVAFLEEGRGVFGPCWTDRVMGEFLQATLMERSEAAEEAARRAGRPRRVIARDGEGFSPKQRIVARTSHASVASGEEDEQGSFAADFDPPGREAREDDGWTKRRSVDEENRRRSIEFEEGERDRDRGRSRL